MSVVAGIVPAVDPQAVFDSSEPVTKAYRHELVRDYLGGSPADVPQRAVAARVDTYLSASAPPTYIVAHTGDHTVPIASVRTFVDRAEAAGVDVEFQEVRWADHVTGVLANAPVNLAERQQIATFFRRHGV